MSRTWSFALVFAICCAAGSSSSQAAGRAGLIKPAGAVLKRHYPAIKETGYWVFGGVGLCGIYEGCRKRIGADHK